MAHAVPFVAVAAVFVILKPLTFPIAVLALVQAWAIPALYAARGAKVLLGSSGSLDRTSGEARAILLLGDLVGDHARELLARTSLVLERGRLGMWVLGERGAVLVRPGGRRAFCYCVKTTDSSLPPSDKIAHLLLALREDEMGFATVANLAFSGATWRVRRRLPREGRDAIASAARLARRNADRAG